MNGATPIIPAPIPVPVQVPPASFGDPLISSAMIFLLTAAIGWRLFSDLAKGDVNLRLAVPVTLSGVALIGAMIAVASSLTWFGTIFGLIACALAGGAAVGGFLIVRSIVSGDVSNSPST